MTDQPTAFDWSQGLTVVTGGASFIGSHLVEALLARGATVRVVDDLSSGQVAHLAAVINHPRLDLRYSDLQHPDHARTACRDARVVFHLAAVHGGRGFIDRHPLACAKNFAIDQQVIQACVACGVKHLVYASSGCVYPVGLQQDPTARVLLTEPEVGPPYHADNLYGWAKLMGELTVQAAVRESTLRAACCRYFTVYGPRAQPDHALTAMMARAFIGQAPFEIWGDGQQIRNWTYVDDVVEGTILAAEHIPDGSAVNLGTMTPTRVVDAARMILAIAGRENTPLRFCPTMPTGPLNRVASNVRARHWLRWTPQVKLAEGLRRTWDWYQQTHDPDQVRATLADQLLERGRG